MTAEPAAPLPDSALDERRFGGLARLYGQAGLARLRAARVVVVGIGGVGSWTAEALARCGVGRLTLIDLDHVGESNINRQIHALASTVGAAKVEVMKTRIADIAADCEVDVVDDFVTPENVSAIVPPCDCIVDAIDQPRSKAALIAHAVAASIPIVVCGAAGGRTDPLGLRAGDLALTRGDALLSAVRARLRREHGFTRQVGVPFKVPALFSDAPPATGRSDSSPQAGGGLSCAGYGSIVTVTATMGMAAAQRAIDFIIASR